MTWPAGHFGVRWRMTSRITALDPPDYFVAAPLGPLGRLAERLVLDRYMAQLIRRRNEHLRKAAEES